MASVRGASVPDSEKAPPNGVPQLSLLQPVCENVESIMPCPPRCKAEFSLYMVRDSIAGTYELRKKKRQLWSKAS